MLTPARVILAYKNFAISPAVSHIGLGVTVLNSVKFLRRHGVDADVWAVVSAQDLRGRLLSSAATHVVIAAPWIPTNELRVLVNDFPETQFAVTCHSNLGFLQADPGAVQLMRQGLELERLSWNFHVAGNNQRFCQWVRDTYDAACAYLPNFYHLDDAVKCSRPLFQGGTLRIGAFGATRPLKNFMTAAGAALQMANQLRVNLELWVSAGRDEGGGSLMKAMRQMINGLPHVKLVENDWQSWPRFRETVRHMHLLLQPSYTETFNVVTADGIAEGVPSVVSHAIEWAPAGWKAHVDDVDDIARVGVRLISDKRAARKGLKALNAYNHRALLAWRDYLSECGSPFQHSEYRGQPLD